MNDPVAVKLSASLAALAMPKSASLAVPSRVMRMLAGLMSRWTMPF